MEKIVNCKYSYNQKVRISKGFYKGFKGVIQKVEETKEGVAYEVLLSNDNKTIKILEPYLTKTFFF